jgi:protein-L-isoaspartate(D-aspartate) O-methyltransferase
MVREQIEARGISNPRVLSAMRAVPRHEFVPEDLRDLAYEDRALPIGWEQTISQPYIVGFMTEAIDPRPGHRVLEIGTGSGYQAAVLSMLAGEVCTIEIVEPLAAQAAETLRRLGYGNVRVRSGDGHLGWPEDAPFDSVIVTCAPDEIPAPLVEQLREGGRMIIPVGPRGVQELILLERHGGAMRRRSVMRVAFVPMTGDNGPAAID